MKFGETVSTLRCFKPISDAKMSILKTKWMKKQTFNKMQWGVRAYNDWRDDKIRDSENCYPFIVRSDLKNLESLEVNDFCESLCMFTPQVTKVKTGKDYPGKTLYEMIVSIQKFLNQNNKPWKLIEGPEFVNVQTVLDNVMKERAEEGVGLVKKQAQYISIEHEEKLWNSNVLGEENPQQLRDTVLFLLGINLGLRAVDEHYDLRRDSVEKPSQISFERDVNGTHCLVYREDSVTKTNDGGIKSLKKERKVVWVYPAKNSIRCPVRLVDKYMSLLPPVRPNVKKQNFYLRELEKINPACN